MDVARLDCKLNPLHEALVLLAAVLLFVSKMV